jgi:hypothetical protein
VRRSSGQDVARPYPRSGAWRPGLARRAGQGGARMAPRRGTQRPGLACRASQPRPAEVAPSLLAGLAVPNEAVLDVPVGLAVPVEAALRPPLDISACGAGLGALGRLLVAALGVPVWLGVTVAARSRQRSAGCPAQRTTSRSRRFVLQRLANSPTRCSTFRSSALLAVSVEAALSRLRSTAPFGAVLGVLVTPALVQPPGVALDLMVCGRCVLRARQGGTQLDPRRGARRSSQARRSPCRSRRHWTTRSGTAPAEAALGRFLVAAPGVPVATGA